MGDASLVMSGYNAANVVCHPNLSIQVQGAASARQDPKVAAVQCIFRIFSDKLTEMNNT